MELSLKDLREEYNKIDKKYKLPSFDELNKDFDIWRIERLSGFMIKLVRRVMVDKIHSFHSFLENILNPQGASMMYGNYINSLKGDGRKLMYNIYLDFSKLMLVSSEREIIYDEKKEAEMILDIVSVWDKNKDKLEGILRDIGNLKEEKTDERKEKSYFG